MVATTWEAAIKLDGDLTSDVSVLAGSVGFEATLGGSGTVKSVSTVAGAVVSPGSSPGVLSVSGSAGLDSGATFRVELNGPAPGTGYDRLSVGGEAKLDNPTLTAFLQYTPADGDSFRIVQAAPLIGTFAGLPDGSFFQLNGLDFRIDYTSDKAILTHSNADTDGDGYSDFHEGSHGENPNSPCAIMRADVDHDHTVTIGDLATVAAQFLQSVTMANQRLNQNGDGTITIQDLALMASNFLQPISACT